MKDHEALLKSKLISQILAISDNTHTSFSAFAFASATAARDTSRLLGYEIETGDFLVRPDLYERSSYTATCDAIYTYIELISITEPFTDLLSSIYSDLLLDGSDDAKRNGRFYTPSSIAEALAMMTNKPSRLEADFCCGMGAISLAKAKEALKQGRAIETLMCLDNDPVAIAACFAQLAYNNMRNPAIISMSLHCKNAITEYNNGYFGEDIGYKLNINRVKLMIGAYKALDFLS
jgi:hypothetical protein